MSVWLQTSTKHNYEFRPLHHPPPLGGPELIAVGRDDPPEQGAYLSFVNAVKSRYIKVHGTAG